MTRSTSQSLGSLGSALFAALDNQDGTFDGITTQGIFVEDEDEDVVIVDDGGGDVPIYTKGIQILAFIVRE